MTLRNLTDLRALGVGLSLDDGLTIVAEGVRTSAQLAMLRSLGCDLFQGEYLSLALPAPAVTQLLLQGAPSS